MRSAEELQQRLTDPAMINVDMRLLIDVALLLVFAAFGGLCASAAGMPPLVGYLLGGMCVGPSGLRLLKDIVAVQTITQFGSIFVLFLQVGSHAMWHMNCL